MLPICNIRLVAQKPCYLDLPNESDTSLGAELKRKRLALEWTQKQTAKHFKVLKDIYQKWEWNQYLPNIRTRKVVNQFLGFNFWDDGSNSISNKMLCYRIEKGISQDELAKLLNISSVTIERIEKIPEVISEVLKHRIDDFLKLK